MNKLINLNKLDWRVAYAFICVGSIALMVFLLFTVTVSPVPAGWRGVNVGYQDKNRLSVSDSAAYQTGDRLWVVQEGLDKYFNVHKVEGSTVIVDGGTDFTLTEAPIYAAYHSRLPNPPGFPQLFNFDVGEIQAYDIEKGLVAVQPFSKPIATYRLDGGELTVFLTTQFTVPGPGEFRYARFKAPLDFTKNLNSGQMHNPIVSFFSNPANVENSTFDNIGVVTVGTFESGSLKTDITVGRLDDTFTHSVLTGGWFRINYRIN